MSETCSAALNIDLLGGRLLDGEAGGGFQLRHPVPAVPQALQHDLAAGVSEVDPQVVELAGVGAIAAVPELNLAPWMGLPVMLSTFWMVRVGFLWFSK